MQKAWPVKKKRSGKKIAFAMILILSVAAFGYSQFCHNFDIVHDINSQDMGAVPLGHMYKIQIDFENPSLLMLAIGESEFTISAGKI